MLPDSCQTFFHIASNQNYEKVNILLVFLAYKRRFSQRNMRVLLGISQQSGCETPPMCSICPKTPPRHDDHWRRQNLGLPFEHQRPNLRRTNRTSPSPAPTHITDHRHWFRGWGNLGYSLGAHSTVPCPRNAVAAGLDARATFCRSGENQPRGHSG